MTTKKTKRRRTRAEVDALVVREALDQSAWEDPIDVPAIPWAKRVPVRRLDLAAKFHVLSVLCQYGADAAFSVSPDKDVDITLVRSPGEVITIDVKVASKATFWKTADFPALDHHFVIVVIFPSHYPLKPPSTYITSSRDLRLLAKRHEGFIDMGKLERLAGDSRNAWDRLLPAA